MLSFGVGLLAGAILGIVIMSLVTFNRTSDYEAMIESLREALKEAAMVESLKSQKEAEGK